MYIQGIDTSLVIASDGTPAFKVGTLGMDSDSNVFQYVHADGVAVVGDVMLIHETFEADQLTVTNSASGTGAYLPIGVAVAALADNEFGWVQVKGIVAAINVATSAAVHEQLNSTATVGRIDDNALAGSEYLLGISLTTAESGNLAPGVLSWPTIDLPV
jgi:hypothetical protein